MRRTTLAVLVVLVLTALAAPASGQPGEPPALPSMVPPVPVTIDSPELSSLARRLGVAPEELARRISLDTNVAALQAYLREHYSSVFGGLSINQNGNVVVRFTDDSPDRRDFLQSALPELRLSIDRVAWTEAQLNAALEMAVGERAQMEASLGGPFDVVVDTVSNRLLFRVRSNTPLIRELLESRYGRELVSVREGVFSADACLTRRNCDPIRGGLEVYRRGTGSTIYVCSTAFTTRYGGSYDAVFTAGHCGQIGYEYFHRGTRLGTVGRQQFEGSVDAMYIGDWRGAFTAVDDVYASPGNKALDISAVQSYSEAYAGQVVCKHGVTTDQSCGTVLNTNVAPSYVINGNRFIQASYCSAGGDSGGSVRVSGQGRAVGIHSGGASATCDNPADDSSVYGHIQFAQEALGVTVRTS